MIFYRKYFIKGYSFCLNTDDTVWGCTFALFGGKIYVFPVQNQMQTIKIL